MGISYDGFKFPKAPQGIRIEQKRIARLDEAAAERICRAEVWRRYGRRCEVPGCITLGSDVEQHHIVPRSRSHQLRFAPENRAVLCTPHHQLRHAGKIEILPRTADGELIVKGDRKYLRFRL